MYPPKHFSAPSESAVREFIGRSSFGLLVSANDGRLDVSHLPFLRVSDDELLCHLACGNPQARLAAGAPVSAIFTGPHAYISPSWYLEPGVPTWNYVAVHIRGRATLFDDSARLAELVEKLTAIHEAGEQAPWTPRYDNAMLAQIVGVAIRVEAVQGNFKLSQNRTARDRENVIARLLARGADDSVGVAKLMLALGASANE